MQNLILGKTFVFPQNDIDTDLIIPARYLTTADPRELACHVLEPLRGSQDLLAAGKTEPKLAAAQNQSPTTNHQQPNTKHQSPITKHQSPITNNQQPIVVAGRNFGCGSSREHAVWALAGAGVQAVIAESFAAIFWRNALNFGLPVLTCDQATKYFATGDQAQINFAEHSLQNLTQGKTYAFEPLPDFLQEIVASGGLLQQVKKSLAAG